MKTLISFLSLFIVVNVVPAAVFAELKFGFYAESCPQAEQIVQDVVARHFATNPFITPGLLRMHFHDCFVRGCDASLLIDSTPEAKSEKATGPNFTVRAYEVIDDAKAALEAACPGIVSCADIISLATRDSVGAAGGPKFEMPTGRRDGLSSSPQDVNLPGPSSTVEEAFQIFNEKGFSLEDMVVLLGAHTVGISHCMFFAERVSGARDPNMDPAMAVNLRQVCETMASPTDRPTAFLDQNTSMVFDNEYFNQLLKKKGLLQIDQNLEMDPSTNAFVTALANDPEFFFRRFATVLVKLSSVEVLIDAQGEIRQNCRVFNDPAAADAATAKAEEKQAVSFAAERASMAIGAASAKDEAQPAQPTTRRLRSHFGKHPYA